MFFLLLPFLTSPVSEILNILFVQRYHRIFDDTFYGQEKSLDKIQGKKKHSSKSQVLFLQYVYM